MSKHTPSSTSLFPTKILHLPKPSKDKPCRRKGYHRITFQSQDSNEAFLHAFRGEFIRDNYHGDGQYCELNPTKGNTLIDGKFYCNDLEGYASETTSNGVYFEGLFKANQRFGPGVMTYADKTQDVGLWRGPKLVRLSVVVQSSVVPKLGVTAQGKSTLVQYRQLIELPDYDIKAMTYTILKHSDASDSLLKKYQLLCNKTCRNKDSLLFDTELYDKKYFGRKDNFINVLMNEDDILEQERLKAELLEEEERMKDSPEVVGLETIEGILDSVMEELGGPTRNDEFATQLLYEAIYNMDDQLERAKEERELLDIRNTQQRNLKQQYAEHFDKTTMKTVQITHLVTWNNEQLAIDLLQHCFLHRNSENLVNFNVCRVLAGDRSDFYHPGVKERKCIEFLVNCSLGMVDEVSDLVLEDGIDVAVVDARGNSGVHYAVAKDKLEIIQLLTNFGAKLDSVNDEHLTPLNMCLLRYLAVLYSVTNWEDAFLIDKKLPPKILNQILDKETAFNPNSSLLNVLSKISIDKDCKDTKVPRKKNSQTALVLNQIEIISMTDILTKLNVVRYSESYQKFESCTENITMDQNYILDNKLIKLNIPVKKSSTSRKEKLSSPSIKAKQSTIMKTNPPDQPEEQNTKELDNIYATLSVLLHYGAKPNACEVPLPSLHLAIYSNNYHLIEMLLQNGANVDIALEECNLTPLHVVSTLPTSEKNFQIFKLLLKYSANVRIRTNATHWPEELKVLQSNYTGDDVLDMDKNALHMLALRYDHTLDTEQYLVKMVSDLIEAGIDTRELYVGHTALTLAMVRQNLSLVELLLQYIDVEQELGCQMGSALTVLVLKRYQNVFTKENGLKMIDLLIFNGANPLRKIGEYGNALDFISKEYFVDKKASKNKKGKNDKKKVVKSKSKASGKGKKSKKALSNNEEIKQYIIKVAKDILIRKIQISIVKFLIQYHSTKEPFNDFTAHLVHFLNYKQFMDIVQQLMYLHEIISCPCLKPFLLQIGTYINSINPLPIPKGSDQPDQGLKELVDKLDYEETDSEGIEAILQLPEYDEDEEIFDVCFQCLQTCDKQLVSCPSCGVVLFCSEACNRADFKLKVQNRHCCQVMFYNTKKNKEGGLENKFKQFQNLFTELNSHRTCCLMEMESQTWSTYSKYTKCSTFENKSTESKALCRLSKSRRSCTSKSTQKPRSSTVVELSSCAHSSFHHSKLGSVQTSTTQRRKLSLMENLLKSISTGTNAVTNVVQEDVLILSAKKDKGAVKNENEPSTTEQNIEPLRELVADSILQNEVFPVIDYKINFHDFKKHQKRHSLQNDHKKKLVLPDNHKREMRLKNAHTLRKEVQNLKGNLNPVLPKGFNTFFVNFRKMFPEFDLTTLLVPYACYRNGQLYYRFLDKEPIFMETYSNL